MKTALNYPLSKGQANVRNRKFRSSFIHCLTLILWAFKLTSFLCKQTVQRKILCHHRIRKS